LNKKQKAKALWRKMEIGLLGFGNRIDLFVDTEEIGNLIFA
jgi:hypothetical protein